MSSRKSGRRSNRWRDEANRRNAALSTGPRTKAGKEASSRNAEKHGLLSERVRVGRFPGETAEAFEAFESDLLADLAPEGAVERMLADRMVSAAWRLRRVPTMEDLVVRDGCRQAAVDITKRAARDEDRWDWQKLVRFEKSDEQAPEVLLLREAVSRLLGDHMYDRLSIYEQRIERGMFKAMQELYRRQARRAEEEAPEDAEPSDEEASEDAELSDEPSDEEAPEDAEPWDEEAVEEAPEDVEPWDAEPSDEEADEEAPEDVEAWDEEEPPEVDEQIWLADG